MSIALRRRIGRMIHRAAATLLLPLVASTAAQRSTAEAEPQPLVTISLEQAAITLLVLPMPSRGAEQASVMRNGWVTPSGRRSTNR